MISLNFESLYGKRTLRGKLHDMAAAKGLVWRLLCRTAVTSVVKKRHNVIIGTICHFSFCKKRVEEAAAFYSKDKSSLSLNKVMVISMHSPTSIESTKISIKKAILFLSLLDKFFVQFWWKQHKYIIAKVHSYDCNSAWSPLPPPPHSGNSFFIDDGYPGENCFKKGLLSLYGTYSKCLLIIHAFKKLSIL